MTTVTEPPPPTTSPRKRGKRRRTSMFAQGESMIWLTGASLFLCLLMILGLLGLITYQGMATFWPQPIVRVALLHGATTMGEVTETDEYVPTPAQLEVLPPERREEAQRVLDETDGKGRRRQLRTGNYELTNTHFTWVSDFEIAEEDLPEWAVVVERLTWGRLYGIPSAYIADDEVVAEGAEAAWNAFDAQHDEVRERWEARKDLEEEIADINRRLDRAKLDIRAAEIEHGEESEEVVQATRSHAQLLEEVEPELGSLGTRISELREENAGFRLRFETATGRSTEVLSEEIVRAYPANRLGFLDKVGVYASRWWEFVSAEPREANSEGGVWPAIFGTVIMTLLMSLIAVPFGVLAALYLREYAKQGAVVSTVRIAINNLAGVPSIVFGVFGLGFFCYFVGGGVDSLFFPEYAPNPKYGKGGILWASLTLALLTLPVVIVATEEALAAVPGSMREGSYACGASKWQTIRRIVLPRAMPGIMTGMILAIARGAGEVAPLMLVGAVKLAPELPVDGTAPFLHPDRSFMHLGFDIYDKAFQSQNSEALKPVVFTTALLLISLVVLLNVIAMVVRGRLRKRFGVGR